MTNIKREVNLTCAERVTSHWQSRHDDLFILYLGRNDNPDVDKFLADRGHNPTEMSDDDKVAALDEERSTYALAFDYVEPETFPDQPEGYFRYQISWGGPSDEIRFYVNLDGSCHRAEYWFLDWFDGDLIDVTGDLVAQAVFEDFAEMGMIKLP